MKHPLFHRSLLAATLAAAFSPAFANEAPQQEIELETINVVGSINKLTGVPFRQAKSAVAISADTLKTEGVEKADELGRYQAGFTNQPYGSDTNTNWFRVRATETSQSVDGLPAYNHQFFTPHVEVFGVESVEITKGSDSQTFGSANPGGLINFISKRPHAEQVGKGEVQAHVGTRGQGGVAADYTGKITADNSLRYRLVGSYRQTDGEWNDTDSKTVYLAPSFAWDISDRTKLTVLASYQRDKGAPSNNFLPPHGSLQATEKGKIDRRTNLGDPVNDFETNKQFSLGYEFSHELAKGLSFSQNYRYTHTDNEHRGAYYSFGANPASGYIGYRGAVVNDGTAKTHALDNRLTWRFKNDSIDNTLLGGIDYRRNKAGGLYSNGGVGITPATIDVFNPAADYGNTAITSAAPEVRNELKQLGFYLQNNARLFKRVGISAGIRHDRTQSEVPTANQSSKNNHTSYSGSVMYYAPYGFNPYYSYSESFDVYAGIDGFGSLYKPAETRQHEIGVKYLPSWLDGSVSLAYFSAKDKGRLLITGGVAASDPDLTKREGVELQAQAQITDNLSGQLAYTYLKSENDRTGVRNPMAPKHSASAKVAYDFSEHVNGLTVGTGIRYIGSSVQSNNGFFGEELRGATVPSATLWDLYARYDFAKNWSAQLNVDNVADKKYVASCNYWCYYGQGRSVLGKVSYKF